MTQTDNMTTTRPATHIAFLDHIRYLMIVLVVVHHAVAAYATTTPHWALHDGTFAAADAIRELLDVFLMPVLFFVAGYLAFPSLQKKGTWGFLKDKAKRLLVPWALAVLVVVPLMVYDQPDQLVRRFRSFWLYYLGSFPIQLRPSQVPLGPTTQVVYWYLSLLFAFFALFALARALASRWRKGVTVSAIRPGAGSPTLATLLLFGVLTAALHFASLLLVPDSSWLTLHVFLEFQATRLLPFAACFALGVYAEGRGWFAGDKPLGSPLLWGVASAVLAAAYLWFGQPVFADTAGTANLPVRQLLAYATIRSFLLLSLLVLFCSLGARYWNRSRPLDRALADASYNIYLTHFWLVVAAQMALAAWVGGPAPVKAAIVLLAALPLSYAISRWVIARWPRGFAVAILALFVFCLVARP